MLLGGEGVKVDGSLMGAGMGGWCYRKKSEGQSLMRGRSGVNVYASMSLSISCLLPSSWTGVPSSVIFVQSS